MTENKGIHELFFHLSTTQTDQVSLLFTKFCPKMVLHHMCAGEGGWGWERGEFRVDGSGYGDNGFFQKYKEMIKKKKKNQLC